MASRPTLDEIRQQVDAGNKTEARRALGSLLYRDSKNADAWWLYAQVAENKDQLYAILSSLAGDDIPSNPYQPRARAMLAKMPYQSVTGKPKLANQGAMLTNAILLVGAIVIALIVVIVGFGILNRPVSANASTVYGSQGQSAEQSDPKQPIQVALVTAPARSTVTPLPTETPKPSSTPRPTSTPKPITPTNTVVPTVSPAEAMPALHDAFSAKVDSLFTLADTVTAQLNDVDKFSAETVQTTLDWVAQIQQLRNKVVTTNLSNMPTEIRQQYIIPAQTAYMAYANSFLYWIDLQMEAARLYKSLETTPSGELKTAQKQWADQKSLVAKQATVVTSNRDALQNALVDYSMETMQIVLLDKASNGALATTSKSNSPLKLNAGVYKVYYYIQAVDNAAPEKIALGLSMTESPSTSMALVSGAKQKLSDSVIVTLQSGMYKVKVDSVSWWVVVLDPAS